MKKQFAKVLKNALDKCNERLNKLLQTSEKSSLSSLTPMKTKKGVKKIKAWAVIVDNGFIFYGSNLGFTIPAFPTEQEAKKFAKVQREKWNDWTKVIPVLITPINPK